MMTLLTKRSDIVAALVSVLLLTAALFWGVRPLVQAIRTERIAIEKEHIAQAMYARMMAQKERVAREQAMIAAQADAIPHAPTEEDIIAMVSDLEHRGDAEHVRVHVRALTAEEVAARKRAQRTAAGAQERAAKKNGSPQQHVVITLRGPFRAVAGFLRILENTPYIMLIDAVTITPQRTVRPVQRAGITLALPGQPPQEALSDAAPDEHTVTATVDARIPLRPPSRKTSSPQS